MTGLAPTGLAIVAGEAEGPVLACGIGLSFWGGVDPLTARVMDVHHPLHGLSVAGTVLMMPTSRGSCSGSGVLLDLALNGRGPAALIFCEPEDVLTLGALVALELFGCGCPVVRVSAADFARLATADRLRVSAGAVQGVGQGSGLHVPLAPVAAGLELSAEDVAVAEGRDGQAAALAMRIICAVAGQQGARALTPITRGHIDGCIYAHPANLIFAEKMAGLGARVRVPTTINAISVDREHWRSQGVPVAFGAPAQRLADAYVAMGCQPTFTCAPYLLDGPPRFGEQVAWAESNAVIYANSVLGARTLKHPDYLDLCMAVVGRAPLSGVYLDAERRAQVVLEVEAPDGADEAFWPLIGYVAGLKSPDRIPVLQGLAGLAPGLDDLKAMCAAFGTTSAAPMLHVAGVTPEPQAPGPDVPRISVTRADLAAAWKSLNNGPQAVDLIAIGSPHASQGECLHLAQALAGRRVGVATIVTVGRQVVAQAGAVLDTLSAAGVQVIPDLCWCSITEPLFPVATTAVMTNSGKYAHYGPGLSGRSLRFGSLADCAEAAVTGLAPAGPPAWLGDATSQRQAEKLVQ